jgi:hypothetical protein
LAQEVLNKNVENPEIGAAGETPAAPATSPTLNDDTKIIVKALVPAVYYTCSKTFDTFAWVEVGDTQEMTYLQLKLMKAKHPRYFTEKWLLPCDDEALNKLNLTSVYRNTLSRGDMKILYGSDVQAAEDLLSGLSDDALTELTQKVKNAVKNGKIVNIKIIRLLEKQLGVELMKLV